jgi:hypothetical protein
MTQAFPQLPHVCGANGESIRTQRLAGLRITNIVSARSAPTAVLVAVSRRPRAGWASQ